MLDNKIRNILKLFFKERKKRLDEALDRGGWTDPISNRKRKRGGNATRKRRRHRRRRPSRKRHR